MQKFKLYLLTLISVLYLNTGYALEAKDFDLSGFKPGMSYEQVKEKTDAFTNDDGKKTMIFKSDNKLKNNEPYIIFVKLLPIKIKLNLRLSLYHRLKMMTYYCIPLSIKCQTPQKISQISLMQLMLNLVIRNMAKKPLIRLKNGVINHVLPNVVKKISSSNT